MKIRSRQPKISTPHQIHAMLIIGAIYLLWLFALTNSYLMWQQIAESLIVFQY